MSVPLPTAAGRIVNLESGEEIIQENGRVNLVLPAGGSAVLIVC
jgi:hypothetical protein